MMVGNRWIDVLDPWLGPNEVRIRVHGWMRVEKLGDLDVSTSKSLRTVLEYTRDYGPRTVARKVSSRIRQRAVSDRWGVVGVGVVLEGAHYPHGTPVAFFAPRQPDAAERVVVPGAFTEPWTSALPARLTVVERPHRGGWSPWIDWHRNAGRESDRLPWLLDTARSAGWEHHEVVDPGLETPVSERHEPTAAPGVSATVIGWGHHARTAIAPSIPAEVTISRIHDIDPLVLRESLGAGTDTSPVLRDDDNSDIVFIAGYHSTHAEVATAALQAEKAVVVEKPLATSHHALRALLDEWVEPSRLWTAFHRRYAHYNAWLRKDLGWTRDDPMTYYAIAHEIALPERHWYRWPSSGSRILANGCHWIDHFLFLNDFASPTMFHVKHRNIGDILCEMELENGAAFSLILTDRGSDRLGTREHVEVRTRDTTAIIDSTSYTAENTTRALRKESFARLDAHERMYQQIVREILAGKPGDSRRSVEVSAGTILDIEEALQ